MQIDRLLSIRFEKSFESGIRANLTRQIMFFHVHGFDFGHFKAYPIPGKLCAQSIVPCHKIRQCLTERDTVDAPVKTQRDGLVEAGSSPC